MVRLYPERLNVSPIWYSAVALLLPPNLLPASDEWKTTLSQSAAGVRSWEATLMPECGARSLEPNLATIRRALVMHPKFLVHKCFHRTIRYRRGRQSCVSLSVDPQRATANITINGGWLAPSEHFWIGPCYW